ncbi:MAG: putative rane protein [Mucilaginibacter sp.]|nr:putative rane protein [Mucilaginibacter sp.]
MKLVGRLLWYFAFFWIVILCAGTFFQYYDFKNNSAFLQIKQSAVKTGWYLPAFYCHIIGSSIILMAGFFQFSKIVYNNRALHKLLGKFYVFGVLFFAAPGAYIMTLFVNRGTGVFISFLLQNTLWVAFTLAAWLLVMNGRINDHIKMVRRSYALAFGAVTLRFYIWLFTVLGSGVGFENNYLIIAFLSWVPNLLVAEWINYRQKEQQFNAA